jgi:hypothetical protein
MQCSTETNLSPECPSEDARHASFPAEGGPCNSGTANSGTGYESTAHENTAHQSTAHNSPAQESAASLRNRRIDDLQLEALAKEDALEANLGAANGGLLRTGFRLEEALEGAMANSADLLSEMERLAPLLDCYLKVMRQVDRFAQLDQRLAATRQTGNPAKPR